MDPPLAKPPDPLPPDLFFLFGSEDSPKQIQPSSEATSGLPSSPPPQGAPTPISTSSSAPWSSLFKPVSRNLSKVASPSFDEDGTPIVKAPDSITLGSSQFWNDHVIAYFHGTPPSPAKIFSDLNPIWGKQGRIRVKKHSDRICLIHIPSEETRKWVLDVGFWHSGNCSFTAVPWTASANLSPMKLVQAPVWVLFKNIPPELWSLEGFSTIASGVGNPVHSEFSKIPPYTNGVTKLKVVIDLYKRRPPVVRITDRLGNSVLIEATYPKLPPRCNLCKDFGHLQLRCPEVRAHAKPPQEHGQAPPPPPQVPLLPSPNSGRVKAGGTCSPPTRSRSLHSSPSRSKESSNSSVAVGDNRCRASRSASPPKVSRHLPVGPISSALSEEAEDHVNHVQDQPSNNLETKELEDPPFQLVVSKKARRKRRQDLLSTSLSESPSEGTSPSIEQALLPHVAFGSVEQASLDTAQPPLN